MSTLRFTAADAWTSAVYGNSSPSTVEFLKNQFSNVSSYATEFGRDFYRKGLESFEFFNGSKAIEFTRSIVGRLKSNNGDIHIVEYSSIEEMRNASVLMQRWIMANPEIRHLFHIQGCDGYHQTYHDVEPGLVGDAHYDYRRVNQTVYTFENDGGYVISEYFDEIKPNDRELILDEQAAILSSWDKGNRYQEAGYDYTNVNGGTL